MMKTYLIKVKGRTIVSMVPEIEICGLYRTARNHRQQIKILTELTLLSKADIVAILLKNGFTLPQPKKTVKSNSTRVIWTNELTAALIEQYLQGKKPIEIAKELGIDNEKIRNKIGELRAQGTIPCAIER